MVNVLGADSGSGSPLGTNGDWPAHAASRATPSPQIVDHTLRVACIDGILTVRRAGPPA